MQSLKYLNIVFCENLDTFLSLMTTVIEKFGTGLPGFACDLKHDQSVEPVHRFLRSFSSLEYFQIRSRWCKDIEFDMSSLKSHSQTLRHIYIGFGGCIKLPGSTLGEQWEVNHKTASRFFKDTPDLRQVALALPEIDIAMKDEKSLGSFGEFVMRLKLRF